MTLYNCGCGGEADFSEKEIRTVTEGPLPKREKFQTLWAAGCTKCGIETAWHATQEAAGDEWNQAIGAGPGQAERKKALIELISRDVCSKINQALYWWGAWNGDPIVELEKRKYFSNRWREAFADADKSAKMIRKGQEGEP